MKIASRQKKKLPPYFFATLGAKIAALQADSYDVIRLDVGSPDLPPAPAIIEALCNTASRSDAHGYQPHRGTKAVREAWAGMYQHTFSVELDPEREIIPLLGSKEGIFNLMQAVLNPGDIVLVPDPGYPTYLHGTLLAGGEPYFMPLLPERGFSPDYDSIPEDIARQSKVLWINYPNNPTAATATLEFFEETVAFGRQYDILLCHDAAYTQVGFDGYRAPSLLQVPGAKEVAVEFNSLSKSHNMAGWRVGVAVGNPDAISKLFALKTHIDSGHFLPIMEAATTALTGDQSWLQERNEIYRQRQDIFLQGLHELGLKTQPPLASLYIWFPVPDGWTSMRFVTALLEQAHLSLTPGTVFGANGEGYVRVSLVVPAERMVIAVQRLKDWWQANA